MKTITARFLTSATGLAQFPAPTLPEICFVGRSNVGKSSLINALFGHPLARVSSEPGRTRMANFFEVTLFGSTKPELRIVDLPGYGFAAASKKMRKEWKGLLSDYLSERSNLKLCVVLVDSNLPAQDPDREMLGLLRDLNRSYMVVATKTDRLPSSRKKAAIRDLGAQLGAQLFPFSTKTDDSKGDLWRLLKNVVPRLHPDSDL